MRACPPLRWRAHAYWLQLGLRGASVRCAICWGRSPKAGRVMRGARRRGGGVPPSGPGRGAVLGAPSYPKSWQRRGAQCGGGRCPAPPQDGLVWESPLRGGVRPVRGVRRWLGCYLLSAGGGGNSRRRRRGPGQAAVPQACSAGGAPDPLSAQAASRGTPCLFQRARSPARLGSHGSLLARMSSAPQAGQDCPLQGFLGLGLWRTGVHEAFLRGAGRVRARAQAGQPPDAFRLVGLLLSGILRAKPCTSFESVFSMEKPQLY